MKGFVLFLLIICSTSSIAQDGEFAGLNNLTVDNARKAIKYYRKKLKDASADNSAELKYYLACSKYLLALTNPKKVDLNISEAQIAFLSLRPENDLPAKNRQTFRFNFRSGLTALYKGDLVGFRMAKSHFDECVNISPKHVESNYFRAISWAYGETTPQDTSQLFEVVQHLNALIQITRDTMDLQLLGEGLLALKNTVDHQLVDTETRERIKDIVDLNTTIYPIEFYGGLYDLDSAGFVLDTHAIYKQHAELHAIQCETFQIDKDHTIPYSELSTEVTIGKLFGLPDSVIIESYDLRIDHYNRLMEYKMDIPYVPRLSHGKGSHLSIYRLNEIRQARHTDFVYFDNVKIKNRTTPISFSSRVRLVP